MAIIHVKSIEDSLLERFDELLDNELSLDDEELAELDALSNFYDAWLDYGEAMREIISWYEEYGIQFIES